MKILALEFSSEQRSAAALDSASDPLLPAGSASEMGGRSTRAFGLIEAVLRQAGWEREQVESIAVGIGPGSYTGIRAAIAIAQGWQLARNVRLLGISSIAALAAGAFDIGLRRRITALVDAQRNEFYLAGYDLASQPPLELEPLRLVSMSDLKDRVKAGAITVGPEVEPFGGRTLFPRAELVAQLAAHRTDFVSGEKLEPIYLRQTSFVKAPPPRVIP